MKISLPWYYFFPLKAKYFRQHPYKTTVKFILIYIYIFIFIFLIGDGKGQTVARISEFNLLLTFLECNFCRCFTEIFELSQFSNDLLITIKCWHCPAFSWRRMKMYLVFYVFISRNNSLLACDWTHVFSFMVFMYSSHKLTSSAYTRSWYVQFNFVKLFKYLLFLEDID
jgi:hypothetical protein